MRRTLLLGAIIVVSLVLESTLLAHLRVGGVHADVLVIAVIAVAMVDGPVTAAIFGFAAGLVSDLLFANQVGVSALVYTVIGFGMGVGRVWVTSSSTLVHLLLAADRYGDLAEANQVRQVVVEAPRGRILDRQGRVLVRNRAAWAITVKTVELGDKRLRDTVLGRLSRLLGVSRAKIDERLRDYNGSPLRGVPVAEDVPIDKLFYLSEHGDDFPGVEPEVVALRQYPQGTLAAHVLGYVGEISGDELKSGNFKGLRQGDTVGKAGVELTYDRYLRGRDGV